MNQTNNFDYIECPYCGHVMNGREACNGDMDCHAVRCEQCKKLMSISLSIEYMAQEMDQN